MNTVTHSGLPKQSAIQFALLSSLEMVPEGHHLAGREGVVMNVSRLKAPQKTTRFDGESFGGLMSGSSATPFAIHGLISGKSAQLLIFNVTDPQVRTSMETMHRIGLMPFVLSSRGASNLIVGATSGPVFSMALADTARHLPAEHKAWLNHVRQLGPFIPLVYGTQYPSLNRCNDVQLHIVIPSDKAHPMHALVKTEPGLDLH